MSIEIGYIKKYNQGSFNVFQGRKLMLENADVLIAQADRAMYQWQDQCLNPIKFGSEQHKKMFCRMLLDTHNPYKPAIIEWPKLDKDSFQRLSSLPIWDIAVQVEGNAGLRVTTYAESIHDPLLREALLMNGAEEYRHKQVLHHMINFYGIKLSPEPDYVKLADLEWGFLHTGFGECIDSFFAFGLFALAKQSGFFPPELVDTFEPVMQEECRHILFFANWLIWHKRKMNVWQRIKFFFKCTGVFYTIARERLTTAGDLGGENFTVTGHQSIGINITMRELLDLCLQENNRRFAGYDQRLARPRFMPRITRIILPFLKLGRRQKK